VKQEPQEQLQQEEQQEHQGFTTAQEQGPVKQEPQEQQQEQPQQANPLVAWKAERCTLKFKKYFDPFTSLVLAWPKGRPLRTLNMLRWGLATACPSSALP
jgi:hypothetical protein